MSDIKLNTGYMPEQKALMVRLSIYVKMRWLVALGIVIITLFAKWLFNISFPLLPVYVISAVILVYNYWMYLWYKKLARDINNPIVNRAETSGYVQVLLDLVLLTVLLHFSGGITNPFIFFYLVHTAAASILLTKRRAYELTTLAVGMAMLLVFLEYSGIISHVTLAGFISTAGYNELSLVISILVSLAILAYITTYLLTSIAGELKRQHHEVDRLRVQILEKDANELRRVTGEIAKLGEERTRFVRLLNLVAHDLQAPLIAVQSCVSYVLDGYAGTITEGQKDWLQRGFHRIDGLLTLITDLLDIPRIESGQLKREMKELSLNEVVNHSLEGLDIIARKKGVRLIVELPQKSPNVYGSNRRLQQVITNLANNAINYTKEGMVQVRLSEDEHEIRLEFIDTGVGIHPEDLPRLFDEFYRGSNVEVKGSGLGLSISKRIVIAHGGKIWAESPCQETGRGSKFTFTIPKINENLIPGSI